MVKHGLPPYLECSSKGEKRLSAFYAMVEGKSIEELYQASKVFEDGSTGLNWKQAKGKKATNQKECQHYYGELWRYYISQHPELLEIICQASGLSDIFGEHGHACQATELWKIRNEHLEKTDADTDENSRESQEPQKDS
jgi:hypothetical protein